MRERDAGGGEPREVDVVEPDAVGEHGRRAQQAVAVVDVEIAAARGKELPHPRDLLLVLGDVRVHADVGMLARELARELELLRRGGRCESRRDRVAAGDPGRARRR